MAYEEGKRGLSVTSIQKALVGIHYPTDKQNLMRVARDNNASESIVDLIQRMPDKQYKSPTDVSQEFGKLMK